MSSDTTFQALVAEHEQRVYRAAYRVLGDRDEALDIAQEAFLALHRAGAHVPRERTGPWLVRVAMNAAIDWLRGRRRAREAAPWLLEQARARAGDRDREGSAFGAGSAAPPDADERERVLRALGRLPARQREAVTLRLWEGLTFAEVARSMGIAEGAAKVHFRRGLSTLKLLLA